MIPNAKNQSVGTSLDRVDGQAKVTGAARFAAEFDLSGLLHAVLVQSTISRGRIRQIDVREAESVPGVRAVMTHLNTKRLYRQSRYTPWDRANSGSSSGDHVPLQDDTIYFNGQSIGLVVANTFEQATYATSLIRVSYEEAPPRAVLEDRLKAARPATHFFGGPAEKNIGSVKQGLVQADVVIEQTYNTPTMHHNPIEPHMATAFWQDNALTVYLPTQWVYGAKFGLAAAFGIPGDQVRAISPYVGGAFGSKGLTWPHIVMAAAAARHVGQPVKLVLTRPQMFTSVGYRTPTTQEITLGAKRNGKLTAIRHRATAQTPTMEELVREASILGTQMLYACPNISVAYRVVDLDVGIPCYMRGPGESTGLFALESALDELAYKLNIDPIELRLRNYAEVNPSTKKTWTSKSLRQCYEQGAKAFGWSKRSSEPGSMRQGNDLIGWGMATTTYPVNSFKADARAKLFPDGTLLVQCATHDLGTGTYTSMTQIAADALGVSPDQVRVELGDSRLPEAPVSGGAMTTVTVGPAVKQACYQVQQGVLAIGISDKQSPLYGLKPEQISAANGQLFATATPTRSEPLAIILKRNGLAYYEALGESQPIAESDRYARDSFGALFAEVRIDPDTCQVRVTRLVAAYGVGQVINPKMATSQLKGGIIFGIGMALMEETIPDPPTGRYVNASIGDYHIAVQADIPQIEVLFIDEKDERINALGAKSVGEIGNPGTAAAIANAVYHATGKRIRTLPITPDKLV